MLVYTYLISVVKYMDVSTQYFRTFEHVYQRDTKAKTVGEEKCTRLLQVKSIKITYLRCDIVF